MLGDLRDRLPEPLRVLLGDTIGTRSPRRPRISVAVACAIRVEVRDRLAEGLLDVDHDQRRPLGVELAAHAGDPQGEARAGGRRPGRRRPSSGPRPVSSRPGEAGVVGAALLALGARLQVGSGSKRATFGLGAALEPRTARARTGSPPELIRSTRSPSVEHPGQDQLRVERGEGGLEPGDAPGRLLEGDLLLLGGVGRVIGARCSRSTPSRRPRSAPGGRPRCAAAGSS